jgi:hypothetical protein
MFDKRSKVRSNSIFSILHISLSHTVPTTALCVSGSGVSYRMMQASCTRVGRGTYGYMSQQVKRLTDSSNVLFIKMLYIYQILYVRQLT